jgi:L-ascorbate metabolism protein UlaG (beta-lactamase superfamily)
VRSVPKITYISNAGVLIDFSGKKVLVDGLCNSELPWYKNPPLEIKERIIAGTTPFDNILLLLFTHHHSDHFDAESTVEFLKQRKETHVIANNRVIEEILKIHPNLNKNRWIGFNPSPGGYNNLPLTGFNIKLISMLHDGKEYKDVQNIAYLIEGDGKKILHVGDARPCVENYACFPFVNFNIDLLIAPFPYISLPSARKIVEKYLKPHRIAIIHFPYREWDRFGWITTAKKNYVKIKEDFVETVFLENIGDSINI